MAQSRQAIQARIHSVDSTKKITKAMQLVASSKLTKQRALMEENREYANSLQELLKVVLSSLNQDSVYLKENSDNMSLFFVINSDMGLCGGYNANIQRALQEHVSKKDHLILVGNRVSSWVKGHGYENVEEIQGLHEDNAYEILASKMARALELFEKKEISSIKILYTQYKNSLTFVPVLETILPLKKPDTKVLQAQTIFEPGQQSMLGLVIPFVTKSILYSNYLESKTSEQASRRMAMESATDNAEELQSELELAFNQARQAAITQEITEIVGGANALA